MNDEENKKFADVKSYKLGERVKLPEKAYSESENRFLGWSLMPDGEIIRKYNVSENDIKNNSITMYAIWK